MPPRKRKANEGGEGGDDDGVSPTPKTAKKSKKEQLAEARARAKAWRDARHAPSESTASPTFSAGASPPAKATPSRAAAGGSAARKRRTPSRKSAGTATRSPASVVKEEEGTSAKRSKRTPASAAASFEFQSPDAAVAAKDAEEEEEGAEEPSTFEFGSAKKRDADESMEVEDDPKPSAAKRKKEEGRARIQALREKRQSQGLKVAAPPAGSHPSQQQLGERKSPPEQLGSPDPPSAAAAASLPAPAARMGSPDPPAAASATAAATKPAAASAAMDRKPPARAQRPPAAVAGLFAPPKRANAAHRPNRQKFDPNNPFPSTGYKLPTAAYCGCGPTPGSTATSAGLGSARGDLCTLNIPAAGAAARRSGSWTARERLRGMSLVDPPHRPYGATAGEEGGRKAPAKPGPPGHPPGHPPGRSPLSARAGAGGPPVPPAAGPAAGLAAGTGAEALRSSMRRVQNMLGLARNANDRRREAMGIPSAQAGGGGVGAPPRPTEAATAPAGPPTAESRPASYGATLRKFREAGGGGGKEAPKGKEAAAAPDGTETVPGEGTSEAGERTVEGDASAIPDVAASAAPASAWKRGCVALFKCAMFLQLAAGFVWLLATAFVPGHVGKASENLAASQAVAPVPGCFLDYPAPETYDEVKEDEVEMEGCEGNYRQCPQWGRCRAGKLVDCDDAGGIFEGMLHRFSGVILHRFVPNEQRNACVPSPETVELMKVVQDTLVKMTVAQTCKSSDRIADANAVSLVEPFPLFSLDKVAENGSGNILLWLAPAFDDDLVRFGTLSGDEGSDIDAVGLGAGVSPNSLPLPLGCTLKLMAWELLEYLGATAVHLIVFSATNAWHLLVNYPIYASIAAVVCYLVREFMRRRRHKAKVNELFDTFLEATYDRLAEAEGHDGYASLILRDEISYDRYPNSYKERMFINEHVWPKIILELRADNRVRKFRRQVNGKDLEHFDLAIQSKHARRRSRSLGPLGRNRDGDAKEPEEEPQNQKRDP